MNPVLACIFRRDEAALRNLLGSRNFARTCTQEDLDSALQVVLGDTDCEDAKWRSTRLRFAETLLLAGASPDVKLCGHPAIVELVSKHDTEMVLMLLHQFLCDVDAISVLDKMTALHIAAGSADEEMVNVLLSGGASANVRNESGNTPLHDLLERSCCMNRYEGSHHRRQIDSYEAVLQSLLPLTDLKLKNKYGNTCLHVAIDCQSPKTFIASLLEAGADQDAQGPLGPPIITACRGGNAEAVRELLKHQCDLSLTCRSKRTALHFAALCSSNAELIVDLLLTSHHDVDCCDVQGCSPLWYAIKAGSVGVTKLLVQNNCNVTVLGGIKYDATQNIFTFTGNKNIELTGVFEISPLRWGHLDIIELALLVLAGIAISHTHRNNILRKLNGSNVALFGWNIPQTSSRTLKHRYTAKSIHLAIDLIRTYVKLPASLKHCCRLAIRKALSKSRQTPYINFNEQLKQCGLPSAVISFVMLSEADDLI